MTVADIVYLYGYTDWANDRMFASLDALDDEQFSRVVGGSFPSVRATAAHIVSAEWIWLERWLGNSPSSMPSWVASAPRDLLHREAAAVRQSRTAFLASLADQDLARGLSFTRLNGESFTLPLVVTLQHVANHSTYHRGQVANLLRQVGGTPVATDLMFFTPQR